MVTRLDVARHAGVSTAVVSYVVNNGPRAVSPKARQAVEKAIEELGYRPNIMARALKGGVSGTIGLIVPSPNNPFFAELAEAIERELSERETLALMGVVGGASDRGERYVDLFLERSVDGIIVVGDQNLQEALARAAGSIPVAFIDRTLELTGASSVRSAGNEGARHAVEHLQMHGHTSIGCIAGPPGLDVSADRVAGWREQMEAVGLDTSQDLVAFGDFTARGGENAADALLNPLGRRAATKHERPTAIFVSSDIQATGLLHVCESLGLRVPEDIAIVSFDGTRAGEFTRPPLTSYRQPLDEMAKAAATAVLDRVTTTALIEGNLVVRASCGCEYVREDI